MFIIRTLLGGMLTVIGLATALSGSILWILHIEILSNTSQYAKLEDQFFIQNFGPKVFAFLVIFGLLKALIGIKAVMPKQKEKTNYGILLS